MPLSPVESKISFWSKIVLFSSTLLFIYSTGLLIATRHEFMHGHHGHHGEWKMHKRGHGPHHSQSHGMPEEMMPRGALASHSHAHHEEHRHNKHRSKAHAEKPEKPVPELMAERDAEMASRHHNRHQSRSHSHMFGGHHEHGPRPMVALHHFAILGMITSLTGIFAAFKERRGLSVIFLILVLISELTALGVITSFNVKAAQTCRAASFHEQHQIIAAVEIDKGNKPVAMLAIERDMILHDAQFQTSCLHHVRHAAVVATIIVGVISCALACCASRHTAALAERDMEEAQLAKVAAAAAAGQQAAVVVEMVMAPQKEQPALPVEIVEAVIPSEDEKAPLV